MEPEAGKRRSPDTGSRLQAGLYNYIIKMAVLCPAL